MRKIQNLKNNNLITKSNSNPNKPLRRNKKLKIRPRTRRINKILESSHSILRNIWEEDMATWKLSKVALNQKNYKKRDSSLMLSEIHLIWEMMKANNKSNHNRSNKPSPNKPNKSPKNNQSKTNKRTKRKTTWNNYNKPWRSLDLREPRGRRKRKKRNLPKRPHNKLLLQNQLRKSNSHLPKNSQLTSTFIIYPR